MSETPNKDLETFFPDGKTIKISDKEYKIKPFVLKNRVEVFKIVTELFKEIKGEEIIELSQHQLGMLLIKKAGERITEIYRLVVDESEEWFQNLTLKNELEIVKAIIEVNDFPFLLGEIQNLQKKFSKKQ